MPSTKVDRSNLITKADEPPSRCRDAVILGISFMFTIAVACGILFYINNNQQRNVADIEKIVERILLAKNLPRNYDADEDEGSRNKRAVHEFRPTKGEIS